MPESPLEAYLRSRGMPLPQPTDSFSAMRATLPSGPPPPRLEPASTIERIQNALAEALGLPSWAPNLPEGSYGLPPSMRAPTGGEGLQDDILAAIDALIQQPVVQALGVPGALQGQPEGLYEPGGGPDKMLSLGMMPDFPTRSAFAEWQRLRGPIPGRKGVSYMKPNQVVARQIPMRTFMAGGNLKKGLKDLDEAGLSGKKLDAAIAKGISGEGGWEDLVARSDPKMFNPDRQRRLVEAGMEGKDFYPLSTEGYVNLMGGDPLMPPLISITSAQDFPSGNANKALLVRSSYGAGDPVEKALQLSGMESVEKGVRRILSNEDFYRLLPPTVNAEEAMRMFDDLLRNASPQQVQTLMEQFGAPKTYNFFHNNRGDSRFWTTDTWGARGGGFAVYDPDTPVLNKFGKTIQGGWVEPQNATQFNKGKVVRKLQQPIGIPTQGAINLLEDVFTHYLAPEFGLTPQQSQAAQWLGTMKYFQDAGISKPVPYHQRAPYNDQLRWRLEAAGVKPRGPGESFSRDEWAQIRDYLLAKRAGDIDIVFGKERTP